MTIAPAILKHFPDLNPPQLQVIGHLDGPLLVVAGPGSGKTYSMVLRALNLLLLGKALPREIVLCTFTEKAAFEMRDRLSAAAQKTGYHGDLSELVVSTIHSLCHRLLSQHRHRTELGHNYETLDELTQLLFIFDHFDEIIGPQESGLYLGRWKTRWTAIEGARGYFDKITEELIEPQRLLASGVLFLHRIGNAYLAYEKALFENNRVDFTHLQSMIYALLTDPEQGHSLARDIRYVLVDEYQDTNYVQEQLLLQLTEKTRNLCVVGDEDQSLYRFRGATVRNILEFPTRFLDCTVVKLTTNYRSHKHIVQQYDRWMASADWSNPRGMPFRYDKRIAADPDGEHLNYPAVFCIWGRDERDEASRFADLVHFLKANGVIEDYPQADRPRPQPIDPACAIRARGPDHPVRSHAPPLRRLLTAAKNACPDGARVTQGPLRPDLAGAPPMALRAAGSLDGPALPVAGADACQAHLQFHRGPEDLRNLSTAVPILP